jgi:hypothetical protein
MTTGPCVSLAKSHLDPSGGEPFPGVGDGEVALEFSDRAQHPVYQPAFAGGGVDALLKELKCHPTMPPDTGRAASSHHHRALARRLHASFAQLVVPS